MMEHFTNKWMALRWGLLDLPSWLIFVMERCEAEALKEASLKPKLYKCFVENTLLIWLHGNIALRQFVDFLNQRHLKVKFYYGDLTQWESAILDICFINISNGTIGRAMCRKHTTLIYTPEDSVITTLPRRPPPCQL